jgi:hypothetical protein
LLGLLTTARVVVAEQPLAQYRINARLSPDGPQITGSVEVAFTNHTDKTLTKAVFLLFPNRFSTAEFDGEINDFNRPYVYPRQEFSPGRMELVGVLEDGFPARVDQTEGSDASSRIVAQVPIKPLKPGDSRTLTVRFRTWVPDRFGSFGMFEEQLTMVGGWYPYLAGLGADGEWQTTAGPPLADFVVEISTAADLEVILNGKEFPAGAPIVTSVNSVHYLSLLAAPSFERSETAANGTHIVYFHRPSRRSWRLSFGPKPTEIIMSALADIMIKRPTALTESPQRLVVVEAPLRLHLTAPGEGAVVVSDRALKVNSVLRPFHERQLAQAVYAETLRPALSQREDALSYTWVSEGLSHTLAGRFAAKKFPDTRSVSDWIRLFDVFAIVDRFEADPRIPFVNAFFDRARVADPLHEQIATYNNERPPGHMVLGKAQALVGDEAFDAAVNECMNRALPFRDCLSESSGGRDPEPFLDEWLEPYPDVNYSIESTNLNQPELDHYRNEVTVRRESSRPYSEPVEVQLRNGRDVFDLAWKSSGDVARMSATTPDQVRQVVIDPDHKLIETRLDDNAKPKMPQIVLDTADIEVSSTEFSISGLVVGRQRHDYHKDVAVAGFVTSRSVGFTAGGRLHVGNPIDATRYEQNLYLFYGFQDLDRDFHDKSNKDFRTDGQLGSIGLRYDYTNVFWQDNPTRQRTLRVYGDWFDEVLGGDFSYLDWGADATATQPLWSNRTIGAVEVLNGFSSALGNSEVPNQGRYSLGGARAIRGIDVERDLGRNILLLRTEVRQTVYPEVDLNLHDILVLRGGQVHAFVDTGRVANSAGDVYDVSKFAVGVGVGFSALYDFLGFFPARAYIEVATRVDKSNEVDNVQFLFGTKQAF